MATFRCRVAAALLLVATARAAEPVLVDWHAIEAETLRHFRALLRMDTSDPPGHETIAAEYLAGVLEGEGIPVRLLSDDPQRANLVARIRGDGSARPIAILAHTDVVSVEKSQWTVDPFGALRKQGYIYGRGAVDDKEHVDAGLMVMLLLARLHIRLKRDVIFIAEAGEEGPDAVGIDFLVQHHWNDIAAEFALAEGGSALSQNGRVRYVAIATSEKVPRGARLVAHGTSGHASRPTLDNAVAHLAAAVAKASAWRTPVRLTETTRVYFESLAGLSPPTEADRYRHVGNPLRGAEIDRYFERYEPTHYAMVRTTVTPTMLRAGVSFNAIPSEAEAYLDVRALPDEDMPRFWSELREVIGDPSVEIEPRRPERPATPPSRLDTALYLALEHAQQKMFPDATTLPLLLTGATDLAALRAKHVQAYGFGPVMDAGAQGGGAHSNDERLAESSLYKLVEFLWYTILDVAAQN